MRCTGTPSPYREGVAVSDLRDKVFVVTGASSGIGEATVRRLHALGARVGLCARRGPRLKEIATELGHERVLWREVDIRLGDQIRDFLREVHATFGRIDGLVANAGIGAYGGITDLTDDEVQDLVETNVTGTVWSVRAAVPYLRAGGGDLVLVSSVAGLRGKANEAVYAATKHAVVGLGGSLDRELREAGVRVSVMCPAATATEFAMSKGRHPRMPELASMMRATDVAEAIGYALAQPKTMRTLLWSMRSMASEN
jgi:NADP-dependent 3-hydroxy acid dehydrogenase YdfG